MKYISLALLLTATGTSAACASDASVVMNILDASQSEQKAGTVDLSDTPNGLRLSVAIQGLKAGQYGFHVHQNGDCGNAVKDGELKPGLAAGGHFDPDQTKSHKGPDGAGHRGDLPKLIVENSSEPVTLMAPKLKLADIRGRALIIHKGGDNYSDVPEAGGGGDRMLCGVIPAA